MRTLALLLCGLFPAVGFSADADLLAAYSQLREMTLDPQRVAAVENFELKKDAATFRFKSGTLYFFKPVLDRSAGAVFIGEAVFPSSLRPRSSRSTFPVS